MTGPRLSWYPTITDYPALATRLAPAPEIFNALARDYANSVHVGVYGAMSGEDANVQDS